MPNSANRWKNRDINHILPYKYKKGQSGNPKGRPKGSGSVHLTSILSKYLKEKLYIEDELLCDSKTGKKVLKRVTAAEVIILRLIKHAICGDMRAINLIFDRIEGKLLDSFEGHVEQIVNETKLLTFDQAYKMKYGTKSGNGYKPSTSTD